MRWGRSPIPAIQGQAARLTREHFDVGWCWCAEIDDAGQVATVLQATRDGLPSLAGRHDLSGIPDSVAVVRTGEQVLNVPDLAKFELLDARVVERYAALGVQAMLGVSLVKDGRLFMQLVIQDTAPRKWPQEAVDLLQDVAERTWAAVERARAEVALRASVSKFSALFATSPAPFLILQPNAPRFTIIDVNDAYLAATMRTCQDLIGRGLFEAFPNRPDNAMADGVNNLRTSLERAIASGRPDTMRVQNYDIARPDGTFEERWWIPVNSPLHGAKGHVEAVVYHVTDVTEERRAQQALRESEAKYRTLFETIGEGFLIQEVIRDQADRVTDLRLLEVNPAFIRQTGLGSDSVGRFGSEFLPNLERFWLEICDRVARTGHPERVEHYDSANSRWYDVHVSRAAGDDRRVAVLFDDITERKQAEVALRDSAERQAFLLKLGDALRAESDTDAVANCAVQMVFEQLRPDRCCIAVYRLADDRADFTHQVGNDRVRRLPDGIRLSDFPKAVRAGFGGTLVIDDVAGTEGLSDCDRKSMAALGMGGLVAATLHKGDNIPLWAIVAVSAGPRRWTHAEITLIEEVSERTWAAMERARAEQALHEADRRKDECLATLAHELRNPLAPIRNALHLLRTAGDGVPTEHVHEMLDWQVKHMVHLLDDLLEVSRISRSAIELRQEPLDLAQVVRDAVETSRPVIDRARHSLEVMLPDEPIGVVGDALRLSQVLANLLNNAARYTDPGGRMELVARRDGADALVEVSDSGIGIAPDQLTRVFAMFGQLDRRDARAQGGLGIGLALAQSLAQMHGGVVEAHSAGLGHGSRFTLRLPLVDRPVPHPDARPPDEARRASPAHRVLVVDDNRDAPDSAGMLLAFLGANVRVEHDGRSALAAIDDWRPALVLLDLGMPGMDGYDVARRVREQPHLAGLKLVALTGWGQAQDRERTRDSGFDQHLVKPIDPALLEALLASIT